MASRTLLAPALGLPFLLPSGAFAAPDPAAGTAHDMTATAHAVPNASFTLRTGIAQGKMVYIGKGGDIEGKVNPTLTVHEGDVVQITIINGEGAEHDLVVPDLHVSSQRVVGPNASSTLMPHATDIGSFTYFCTVAGHRQAGMEGLPKVEPAQARVASNGAVSISRDPVDVPPVGERGPITVRYGLEAVERVGKLDDKTTYDFWTFNDADGRQPHLQRDVRDDPGGAGRRPAEGGATAVDINLPVPGKFVLVDQALARMERGLAGALTVDGPPAPATYSAGDGSQASATPAAVVPAAAHRH